MASAEVTPIRTNGSGLSCLNCSNAASRSNMCPSLGIRDAFFCSAQCFKDNWKEHKKLHVVADTGGYVFPEGTKDGLAGKRGQKYTGALRAVYPDTPVPKRQLPDSIPKPDYATASDGRSFKERVALMKGSMGRVHSEEEIAAMRKSCRLTREVLDITAAAIRPGITTLELDEIVHAESIKRNSYPSPLGYSLFPRSVCTSVNEVICHGIPDARPLENGDIINLDVSLFFEGFHGDVNATYPVGDKVTQQNLDLIATSRACLDEAIRLVKPGTPFRDIGNVIEATAKASGFSSNKTYVGHGINQLFHANGPNVPHYADSRQKDKMKAGMIFTIEPMICAGLHQAVHWADNWTAVTPDGKPSAQWEETILCTETSFEVLTAAPGWVLPPKPATK